ncbi:MAG TPA: KaiC domain-containing protein [Candidatus Methanoperedenaceae archaeon]|nr:KaiC domain-containing protein [Candidatus Methanoperedenaceae archaeon]
MELLETGIEGLDVLLGGGIPENHVVAVIGAFGTGKSTIGLQFIHTGLEKGEKCIYICMEETEENVIRTAESFGWDLQPHIESGGLVLIRLSALNIKATITRVESDLPELLKSFGPSRIVIDSITMYEMIHDSDTERRDHLLHLVQVIKDCGATSLLTSETARGDPYHSKFGLVEYVTDGVISLRYLRYPDLSATTNLIEVSKMRRHEHSHEIKPYSITKRGIVVHSNSEVFSTNMLQGERFISPPA